MQESVDVPGVRSLRSFVRTSRQTYSRSSNKTCRTSHACQGAFQEKSALAPLKWHQSCFLPPAGCRLLHNLGSQQAHDTLKLRNTQHPQCQRMSATLRPILLHPSSATASSAKPRGCSNWMPTAVCERKGEPAHLACIHWHIHPVHPEPLSLCRDNSAELKN